MMDLFITNTQLFTSQTLADGVVWCGLLLFLSAVWTLILAPIHCRAYIGEQIM